MFPHTISNQAVTVFVDGHPRTFPSTHSSFDAIKVAILNGDEDEVRVLSDVKANITKVTSGRVNIFDNEIQVDGRVVSGRLIDRILEMVRLGGQAIEGYVNFLDNLMDNPSKRAVDELYLFIEACDLPITEDGHFLAYKRVRNDYKDIHSGEFDNSVGATPSMPRNEVCEDRDTVCAEGLHFCSFSYLPSFGSGAGNHVMVVKINPADVVSIPSDYNNAKGRAWKYEVVSELENWEGETITPWFTDEYAEDDEDNFEDIDAEDFDDFDADDFDLEHQEHAYESMHFEERDVVEPTPAPIDTSDGDGKFAQKLSWVDVREIRRLFSEDNYSLTHIAGLFGISRRQAARIRDNESWHDANYAPALS